MSERKQWPSFPKHPRETYPPQFNALSDQWKAALLDYERNRADAYKARLELAVEHLKDALRLEAFIGDNMDSETELIISNAQWALKQIGELP